MKNRKTVYERHIQRLEKSLGARSDLLKSRKLTGKKRRLDPQFRQIEGHLKQYKFRLTTIQNMEKLVSAKAQG